MKYLDFDMQIERASEGYRARITKSPVGEATSKIFTIPFSELELENFFLKIGLTQRSVRRIEAPEMDAAKKFGARLFETVFEGQVQSRLMSSIDLARTQGAGLRIRLRLTDAPQLAGLPWEYLYNPGINNFLALSDSTPIVRYLDVPRYVQPLKVKHPLRVLVMLASPTDYPALNVEREWERLREALGDLERSNIVKLERLQSPTMPALRRQLQRPGLGYHVLHFIGHGDFDVQTQDGVLLFENEQRRSQKISGQTLSVLLHNHEQLRLVVLNACGGARGSVDDPFTGTAQGIVQQGIPAVIAMQFDISDLAAICFSHEFYMSLADGCSVDEAITASRIAMFTDGFAMEWGTPVLYLHSSDGSIFEVDAIPDVPEQTGGDPPEDERFSETVNPPPPPPPPGPVLMLSPPEGAIESQSPFYIVRDADRIVDDITNLKKGSTFAIKGPRQVGKSSLLLRTAEAASRVGKHLALIDFQEIDDTYFANSNTFFRNFCEMFTSELKLDSRVDEYLNPEPNIRKCTKYVGEYLLQEAGAPVVLALDEVEKVFVTPFQTDFFSMLRGWHNRRARFNDPIWKCLDIVIVTSTEPHYFIKDLSQSPFNVATKIFVDEFKAEHLSSLNTKYCNPLKNEQLDRLMTLVGGHPYLSHYAIYTVATRRNSAEDLFLNVRHRNNPFREYLQQLALRLENKAEMLAALKTMLREKQAHNVENLMRLEGAGLVRQEGDKVVPRCQLYENFFKEYFNV